MKSLNIISLFESAQVPQVPGTDVPSSSDMPPAITGDDTMENAVTTDLDKEKNEEKLNVKERTIYEDLPNLDETMVQSVLQTYLTQTSRATIVETPDTNSATNRATEYIGYYLYLSL